MKALLRTLTVFIAVGFYLPLVHAASFVIDDSVEGEVTLRHDGNFEFGVTSNGVPFGPGVGGSTTVPGETGEFSGTWYANTGNDPNFPLGVIYIVDPSNPSLVSDIIEAAWGTQVTPGFDIASIDVTITSSACGENLGTLPQLFKESAVIEPDGQIGINSLFVSPISARPVFPPSNIGLYFVAALDSDCDGITDSADLCPGTVIPEAVPTRRLGTNRWALTDGDGVFDTTAPKGRGPERSYTVQDTGGCSCEQIIAAQDLGQGHSKFGCSISAMDHWVTSINP